MYSYIHIPFCNNKCKYCRFASVGIIQEKAKKKYLNKLLIDINNYDSKINRLKSIYFGGGTPSILEIDEILNIIQAMKSKFGFYKNIEINLETTPNNITKKNLVGWKKIGINRISIGIQTLNNKSLQEIGRGNKSNIFEALDLIRNIGFENISIDFIIGLPYVSIGEIQNNINYILNKYNFIKHISVYMLEDYYEINDANNKFDKITYPNNWTSLGIKQEDYLFEYINIKNNLKKHGFNPYEISNFAKKGYECKHNKSYWNHSNVIAFGLGAHFFINNSRSHYSDTFKGFYNNEIILDEVMKKEDIFLENVMFGLRTTGLNNDLQKELNTNKINEFIDSGFLKLDNSILKLTNKGVLLIDYILKEII